MQSNIKGESVISSNTMNRKLRGGYETIFLTKSAFEMAVSQGFAPVFCIRSDILWLKIM